MREGYEKLGQYIAPVDIRNRDLSITNLLGVSIEKKFIPSIANIVGTDLSSYKIVRTGQFAYGPVTSRNGDKISIALLEGDDCIISSSYSVFEIINKEKLNAEYLMLWFSRPEFDRYARFRSHGSVREIFDWEELCSVELPIPDIKKQKEIVNAYRTITKRIELKRKINDNLEESLKAMYKHISSEAIGDKITITVGDFCKVFTGKKDVNQAIPNGINRFYSCSPTPAYSNDAIYTGKAILVAGNGSFTGRTIFVDEAFDLYQRTYAITPVNPEGCEIFLIYAGRLTDHTEAGVLRVSVVVGEVSFIDVCAVALIVV